MSSKSQAQHNMMAAAAHDPKFAKKVKVSQDVAEEFVAADKKQHKFEGKQSNKSGSKDW